MTSVLRVHATTICEFGGVELPADEDSFPRGDVFALENVVDTCEGLLLGSVVG